MTSNVSEGSDRKVKRPSRCEARRESERERTRGRTARETRTSDEGGRRRVLWFCTRVYSTVVSYVWMSNVSKATKGGARTRGMRRDARARAAVDVEYEETLCGGGGGGGGLEKHALVLVAHRDAARAALAQIGDN